MKTRSSALVLGLCSVLSAVFAGVDHGQNCSHGNMSVGVVTGCSGHRRATREWHPDASSPGGPYIH